MHEQQSPSGDLDRAAASAFGGDSEVADRTDPLFDELYERARSTVRDGVADGPFCGVPFLIKDALPLAGAKLSLGSVLLRHNVSPDTHEIARRMVGSGLVICGRTNMSELGLLPVTEPSLYGPTRNPWHNEHSPGGSSGGSAAAVAARLVVMAHAQDGGGSIRIPSSACGVFGLKPSRGRTPQGPARDPFGYISEHVITLSVRDSATMLDVLDGPDPGDPFKLPAPSRPFAESAAREPPRLRIAFMPSAFGGEPVHPDCAEAVRDAARLCATLGHAVEERAPAIDLEAFDRGFEVLWAMSANVFFRSIPGELERLGVPRRLAGLTRRRAILRAVTRFAALGSGKSPFEPFTWRLAERDASRSPADLWLAWDTMRRAGRELRRFLTEFDVLVTPVLGEPPWRIGELDQKSPTRALERRLFRYVAFTPICNTEGLPAMSVPLSWNANGLPIGVQFMARHAADDLLLGLAGQLERARPWMGRRPPGPARRTGRP